MLLRDSPFKGNASYENVIQRAQNSAYNDQWGYKSEFIGLVQKAASLDPNHYQNQRPIPQPYYAPWGGDQQYQPQGYDQKGNR